MKNKLMILGIICFCFITGCQKDQIATYTPDCSGGTKSFATDVKPLFQSYCIQCHNVFSTYGQISADKSSIRNMIVSGSMPQNASLTTDQKNKIVCWIDNGAPNN
jgi:hypothetical protein